jgi:hypothetical protein
LAPGSPGFTAELPAQDEPEIGQELIVVRLDDGTVEELRLHDYQRLYSFPGLYEQIVHGRLGCRSPQEIAAMLALAIDELGWDPNLVRVLDLAAGNGVSGEALAAQGLRPVLGLDIVPAAREAALRDRPHLYEKYMTVDLLALSPAERDTIRALGANAVSCVAPVGEHPQQLPPPALAAAVGLMAPDVLVAFMHDPSFGTPDRVTPELWVEELGPGTRAELVGRRRYVHRYTVGGEPIEMDGVVWRVQRS